MWPTPTLALLLLSPLAPGPPTHFTLDAVFEPPAKPGQAAAVAVTFRGTDPAVYINEEPAPRLKLDPLQTILLDKQEPSSGKGAAFDPEHVRTLDLTKPVRFATALAKDAPRGTHFVKATVIYFYCSKREAWCRRGATEIEVPVEVK
jgi:hypothetical protein